jgi:broad specificity phosphatase PhoE
VFPLWIVYGLRSVRSASAFQEASLPRFKVTHFYSQARRSVSHESFDAMTHRSFSLASTASSDTNLLFHRETLRHDFFALRHGQSLANVAHLIASNPNVACDQYGLSATGHEQAKAAGVDVVQTYEKCGYGGIAILSSDLLRARETADAVRDAAEKAGLPIYRDSVVLETSLRERGFGKWDLSSDSNYDTVWEADAMDSSHEVEGVESVDAVMKRATACVSDWDATLPDSTTMMVVCVAHGDVLQILQTAFEKKSGVLHRSVDHLETAKLRPLRMTVTKR